MGGQSTKQEVKAEEAKQITENSSGTHLIELHASSMGMGIFTMLALVFSLGCMYIAYHRCMPHEDEDEYTGHRGHRGRQHRGRRHRRSSVEEFGYFEEPRVRSQSLQQDLLDMQIEDTVRSLMARPPRRHRTRHAYDDPRRFEELEMHSMDVVPVQRDVIASVHRPQSGTRGPTRPVAGTIRAEIADPPVTD